MTTDAAVSPGAAPGRLGDPSRTLRTDPRSDPRMVAALAPFGLDGHPAAPPVSPASPRADLLSYMDASESGFEGVFTALMEGLPAVEGVESSVIDLDRADGSRLRLYAHRPTNAAGPLPCVYQIHGGGMVIIEATSAVYSRWRDELAATGIVVIGVEFRNGGGKQGPFPFPAGLDDCAQGLRWAADHMDELGASHIVVSGDSGGANLALALAIKANHEGWVNRISGVYAHCPFIYGAWADRTADLPSLSENAGYFIDCDLMQVLSEVYDPGAKHAKEPTCWPYWASAADLKGLPPHVISVNELDLLRDEGLAYYRKLLAAGVPTTGRMNLGVCHDGEIMFRGSMPDLYDANLQAINGFARSLR